MKKIITFLSLCLVVFSLLGIVDASYITYEKFSGRIPPCSIHFKCTQVLESKWANIGPIPLSLLGVCFYSLFLVVSISFLLGKRKASFFLALFGVFGLLFSLYLVFIMGVVLKAWCFYCLLSAVNCVILFGVSSVLYLLTKRRK
jgi:uncharacterized membrane protein